MPIELACLSDAPCSGSLKASVRSDKSSADWPPNPSDSPSTYGLGSARITGSFWACQLMSTSTKQGVVMYLLHQCPFTSCRMKHSRQHCAPQLLRRYRSPDCLCVNNPFSRFNVLSSSVLSTRKDVRQKQSHPAGPS